MSTKNKGRRIWDKSTLTTSSGGRRSSRSRSRSPTTSRNTDASGANDRKTTAAKTATRNKNLGGFTCVLCAKHYKRRGDFWNHLAEKNGVNIFVCLHCGEGYRKDRLLRSHICAHGPKEQGGISVFCHIIACQECGYFVGLVQPDGEGWRNYEKLCSHKSRSFRKITLYTWTAAAVKYIQQNLAQVLHVKIFCGPALTTVSTLCTICGVQFTNVAEIEEHLLANHGGTRSITCKFCPHKFSSSVQFHLHVHEKHRNGRLNLVEFLKDVVDEKPFTEEVQLAGHFIQCDLCLVDVRASEFNDHDCAVNYTRRFLSDGALVKCPCVRLTPFIVDVGGGGNLLQSAIESSRQHVTLQIQFTVSADVQGVSSLQYDSVWSCKHCHLVFDDAITFYRHIANVFVQASIKYVWPTPPRSALPNFGDVVALDGAGLLCPKEDCAAMLCSTGGLQHHLLMAHAETFKMFTVPTHQKHDSAPGSSTGVRATVPMISKASGSSNGHDHRYSAPRMNGVQSMLPGTLLKRPAPATAPVSSGIRGPPLPAIFEQHFQGSRLILRPATACTSSHFLPENGISGPSTPSTSTASATADSPESVESDDSDIMILEELSTPNSHTASEWAKEVKCSTICDETTSRASSSTGPPASEIADDDSVMVCEPDSTSLNTRSVSFGCKFCSRTFYTANAAHEHGRSHVYDAGNTTDQVLPVPRGQVVYVCRICCLAYQSRTKYATHIAKHGTLSQCSKCSAIALNPKQLSEHMASHIDPDESKRLVFGCSLCFCAARSETTLMLHAQHVHSTPLIWFCMKCSYAHDSYLDVSIHCLVMHQIDAKSTPGAMYPCAKSKLHFQPMTPYRSSAQEKPAECPHRTFNAYTGPLICCSKCGSHIPATKFAAENPELQKRGQIQFTFITEETEEFLRSSME